MAITPEDFDEVVARIREGLFPPAPKPPEPPAPPRVQQPTVTLTVTGVTDTTITVRAHLDNPGAVPLDGVRIGRDGEDITGAGPWSTVVRVAPDNDFTFARLLTRRTYLLTAAAVVSNVVVGTPGAVQASPGGGVVVVGEDPDPKPPVDPPVDPKPPTPPIVTKPVNGLVAEPPVLTDPLYLDVPVGGKEFKGLGGRDIVLVGPKGKAITGSVSTYGGHHVVGQGLDIQSASQALKLQHMTGTVYLEGLHIGRPDGSTTEGINWSAADTQHAGERRIVQNSVFEALSGSRDTNHSDGNQDWSGADGVEEILAGILAADVTYQWLMWQPEKFGKTMKKLLLQDVVLRHTGKEGYLLYFTGKTPVEFKNVHLYTDDVAGAAVYPKTWKNREGLSLHAAAEFSKAPTVITGKPGKDYTPLAKLVVK